MAEASFSGDDISRAAPVNTWEAILGAKGSFTRATAKITETANQSGLAVNNSAFISVKN